MKSMVYGDKPVKNVNLKKKKNNLHFKKIFKLINFIDINCFGEKYQI